MFYSNFTLLYHILYKKFAALIVYFAIIIGRYKSINLRVKGYHLRGGVG